MHHLLRNATESRDVMALRLDDVVVPATQLRWLCGSSFSVELPHLRANMMVELTSIGIIRNTSDNFVHVVQRVVEMINASPRMLLRQDYFSNHPSEGYGDVLFINPTTTTTTTCVWMSLQEELLRCGVANIVRPTPLRMRELLQAEKDGCCADASCPWLRDELVHAERCNTSTRLCRVMDVRRGDVFVVEWLRVQHKKDDDDDDDDEYVVDDDDDVGLPNVLILDQIMCHAPHTTRGYAALRWSQEMLMNSVLSVMVSMRFPSETDVCLSTQVTEYELMEHVRGGCVSVHQPRSSPTTTTTTLVRGMDVGVQLLRLGLGCIRTRDDAGIPRAANFAALCEESARLFATHLNATTTTALSSLSSSAISSWLTTSYTPEEREKKMLQQACTLLELPPSLVVGLTRFHGDAWSSRWSMIMTTPAHMLSNIISNNNKMKNIIKNNKDVLLGLIPTMWRMYVHGGDVRVDAADLPRAIKDVPLEAQLSSSMIANVCLPLRGYISGMLLISDRDHYRQEHREDDDDDDDDDDEYHAHRQQRTSRVRRFLRVDVVVVERIDQWRLWFLRCQPSDFRIYVDPYTEMELVGEVRGTIVCAAPPEARVELELVVGRRRQRGSASPPSSSSSPPSHEEVAEILHHQRAEAATMEWSWSLPTSEGRTRHIIINVVARVWQPEHNMFVEMSSRSATYTIVPHAKASMWMEKDVVDGIQQQQQQQPEKDDVADYDDRGDLLHPDVELLPQQKNDEAAEENAAHHNKVLHDDDNNEDEDDDDDDDDDGVKYSQSRASFVMELNQHVSVKELASMARECMYRSVVCAPVGLMEVAGHEAFIGDVRVLPRISANVRPTMPVTYSHHGSASCMYAAEEQEHQSLLDLLDANNMLLAPCGSTNNADDDDVWTAARLRALVQERRKLYVDAMLESVDGSPLRRLCERNTLIHAVACRPALWQDASSLSSSSSCHGDDDDGVVALTLRNDLLPANMPLWSLSPTFRQLIYANVKHHPKMMPEKDAKSAPSCMLHMDYAFMRLAMPRLPNLWMSNIHHVPLSLQNVGHAFCADLPHYMRTRTHVPATQHISADLNTFSALLTSLLSLHRSIAGGNRVDDDVGVGVGMDEPRARVLHKVREYANTLSPDVRSNTWFFCTLYVVPVASHASTLAEANTLYLGHRSTHFSDMFGASHANVDDDDDDDGGVKELRFPHPLPMRELQRVEEAVMREMLVHDDVDDDDDDQRGTTRSRNYSVKRLTTAHPTRCRPLGATPLRDVALRCTRPLLHHPLPWLSILGPPLIRREEDACTSNDVYNDDDDDDDDRHAHTATKPKVVRYISINYHSVWQDERSPYRCSSYGRVTREAVEVMFQQRRHHGRDVQHYFRLLLTHAPQRERPATTESAHRTTTHDDDDDDDHHHHHHHQQQHPSFGDGLLTLLGTSNEPLYLRYQSRRNLRFMLSSVYRPLKMVEEAALRCENNNNNNNNVIDDDDAREAARVAGERQVLEMLSNVARNLLITIYTRVFEDVSCRSQRIELGVRHIVDDHVLLISVYPISNNTRPTTTTTTTTCARNVGGSAKVHDAPLWMANPHQRFDSQRYQTPRFILAVRLEEDGHYTHSWQ